MAKGFVYVMSNPALPGLVKIGFSMKDPHLRAGNDFDPAGLPDDYIVEYHALVDDPRQVEQQVHAHLAGRRYKKEWFSVNPYEAVLAIKKTYLGDVYYEEATEAAERPSPNAHRESGFRTFNYCQKCGTRNIEPRCGQCGKAL